MNAILTAKAPAIPRTVTLDAVGVGAGPFNLSLAALLAPFPRFGARFFDQSPDFQWHPGLLFREATIQVSYLKDLVTLVDPTSEFSFLAFLRDQRRLYRFLNRSHTRVSRLEFNQYLRWVAARLPNVEFGAEVREIGIDGSTFKVMLDGLSLRTTNVVLGTGLVPNVPACARAHLGREVFHSIDYLGRRLDVRGKVVAVVGGGQSGAEVVNHLLLDDARLPRQLVWTSRRPNFFPLDESPFTNELFSPPYSDHFFRLPPERQSVIRAEQKLASDGIAEPLLQAIYDRLYDLEFLEPGGRRVRLLTGQELVDLEPASPGWQLDLRDRWGATMSLHADIVVLATGSSYAMPAAMRPLAAHISWDKDGYVVRPDFSVDWDGPPQLRIFAQNAARHMRGVADPNLSLMAWRSGLIANSLLGFRAYEVTGDNSVFDFNGT